MLLPDHEGETTAGHKIRVRFQQQKVKFELPTFLPQDLGFTKDFCFWFPCDEYRLSNTQ